MDSELILDFNIASENIIRITRLQQKPVYDQLLNGINMETDPVTSLKIVGSSFELYNVGIMHKSAEIKWPPMDVRVYPSDTPLDIANWIHPLDWDPTSSPDHIYAPEEMLFKDPKVLGEGDLMYRGLSMHLSVDIKGNEEFVMRFE